MELTGQAPQVYTTIELQGLFGSFDIGSNVVVHYFSTKASNNLKGSGSHELLKSLKPVREQLKSSKLKNLDSLLQRDLDDNRVSQALIPYLQGKFSNLAFFPSVLGVIMPKKFLEDNSIEYPVPHKDYKDTLFKDYWKFQKYSIGEFESDLGLLSIYPEKTSIIVIDGQHRTTAFRHVSGTLFDGENSKIYEAFYDEIEQGNFKAELPITLIWFESKNDTPLDPKLISRKLFVDVNNSARNVSRSRTILLNEKEIISILTRFFYSHIAGDESNDSFRVNEFSLFHAAFDVNSDLSSKGLENRFSITSPEIIYDIFSWFFLGNSYYDSLDKYVVKRLNKQDNIPNYSQKLNLNDDLFVKINDDDGNVQIVIKDNKYLEPIKENFDEKWRITFDSIYSKFSLFLKHFEACSIVESKYQSEFSSIEQEVWDRIFKGGEGLYYTFKSSATTKSTVQKYKKAITEIESKFTDALIVVTEIDDSYKIFESIKTKAFQIGLCMAYNFYYEKNKGDLNVLDNFLQDLNKYSVRNWYYVFTELRPQFIPSVTPRHWPSYQKLVLRMLNTEEYYNTSNFEYSPEGVSISNSVKTYFKRWKEDITIEDIEEIKQNGLDPELKKEWFLKSSEKIMTIMEKCQIKPIDFQYQESFVNKIIEKDIENLD